MDPLDPEELQRRRRLVADRCIDAARAWLAVTHGAVDDGTDEWRARLGEAVQEAARELARTGALSDLGIERPEQIGNMTCELLPSDELQLVETYSYTFSFGGTDLADPTPGLEPPPPAADAEPART